MRPTSTLENTDFYSVHLPHASNEIYRTEVVLLYPHGQLRANSCFIATAQVTLPLSSNGNSWYRDAQIKNRAPDGNKYVTAVVS
jgi:hypothetical protein